MKLDDREKITGKKRTASGDSISIDTSSKMPSTQSATSVQTASTSDSTGSGSQDNVIVNKSSSPASPEVESMQATDIEAEHVPKRLRPQDPDLEIKEVTNDGEPENMEMLIHLKEIFHAQLPKMPKEYIVRLVFDRKHRSIVLTKKGVPIGGITYRPFKEQMFAEIAFCAVVGNAQVQGHGSRLMNELKRVAIRTNITHFHTYADNYAIGYFAKHGFTKQLTMSRDRWVSYVKDYDGGTHMECYVHPTIPYLSQAEMFAKQREWLVQRIAETSSSTRVLPGLPKSVFHDGGRVRHIDIPGIIQAGWTEDDLNAQNRRKSDRDAAAQHKMRQMWREIEKNDNSWPFRDPVDLQEVPDYTKVVAHPIDLSQIRDNIEESEPKPIYETKERMKIDLDLMISNCKTYNAENTDYWAAADALEKFIDEVYSRN